MQWPINWNNYYLLHLVHILFTYSTTWHKLISSLSKNKVKLYFKLNNTRTKTLIWWGQKCFMINIMLKTHIKSWLIKKNPYFIRLWKKAKAIKMLKFRMLISLISNKVYYTLQTMKANILEHKTEGYQRITNNIDNIFIE